MNLVEKQEPKGEAKICRSLKITISFGCSYLNIEVNSKFIDWNKFKIKE
jgi:hypothetical protein